MSKNPSVRGMYERKAIAILLSAVITIIMQTAFMIPAYQPDAKTSQAESEEVIEKDKKPFFRMNVLRAHAIGPTMPKANTLLMTTTLTTTTTTTTTSTSTSTTTTSTTTTSETTTTTTTTVEPTTAEEVYMAEVEDIVEETVVYEEEVPVDSVDDEYVETYEEAIPEYGIYETPAISVSDSDYILLCNAVGHEYGSNWVSVYDKALVVEVIMNRVNSSLYPNTIYDVLTAPYQFSGAWGYVNLGTYSYQVTDSVKEAVNYYLNNPDQFQHGYLSFWGDGTYNHFS